MMGNYSSSMSGAWIWLHLHWLFWGVAIFGFVVAIIWISKYAKKDDVRKLMWTTLLIGIIGGIITVPLARSGWYDMMGSHHQGWGGNNKFETMMGDEDFEDKMFDHMREEMNEMFEETENSSE